MLGGGKVPGNGTNDVRGVRTETHLVRRPFSYGDPTRTETLPVDTLMQPVTERTTGLTGEVCNWAVRSVDSARHAS
jgi:hypothetical protein